MTQDAFDAAEFVTFDLGSGNIKTPLGEKMTLVPVDVLNSVAPTPKLKEASIEWGKNRGGEFVKKVDVASANLEILAGHLRGEAALMGIGKVTMEVYGQALLLKMASTMNISAALKEMIEGFYMGFLSTVGLGTFEVSIFKQEAQEATLFIGHPNALQSLTESINAGKSIVEAIGKLHGEVD